jgi:hypothetical protein
MRPPRRRLNTALTITSIAFKPSQSSKVVRGSQCVAIRSTLKQIIMTARTRDTLALFAIGSLAILVVLFPGSDLERLFHAVLAHW